MEHVMLKSKNNKQTQPNFTSVHGRETDSPSVHAFSLYTILLLPSTVAEETKAQLFEPAAPKVSQDPNTFLIQANWMTLQVTPQEWQLMWKFFCSHQGCGNPQSKVQDVL